MARLLDTSKNTYYFLFILTKKVVLHKSPKTLLAKKKHYPISIVMSQHDLACCGMLEKSSFCTALACCGMNGACCGMPVSGFLTGRPHAAACSRDLPTCRGMLSWLAQFCFLWLLFAPICLFSDHSTRTSPTRWKHILKCPKQVINNTKH